MSRCAGRQLLRAGENRAWLGHVAKREVLLDRTRIDLAPKAGVHQQRLEFRSEQQRAVGQHGVEERLHAQPVARHEQRLAIPIVEREREHAAEAIHASLAPGLPRVDDHLGVAARVEHVPEGLQLRNQFLVVVDLPVEDHDHRAVLVVERLLTRGDVDDRQAPMAEAHAGLEVQALTVRAAVCLRVVHALQQRAIEVAARTGVEQTCNATHGQRLADDGWRVVEEAWTRRQRSANNSS